MVRVYLSKQTYISLASIVEIGLRMVDQKQQQISELYKASRTLPELGLYNWIRGLEDRTCLSSERTLQNWFNRLVYLFFSGAVLLAYNQLVGTSSPLPNTSWDSVDSGGHFVCFLSSRSHSRSISGKVFP